jgi:hypothetical protein
MKGMTDVAAVRRVRLHLTETNLVWVDVVEYADGSVWVEWRRANHAPNPDGTFFGKDRIGLRTFADYVPDRVDFERRIKCLVRVEWLAGDPLELL